MSSPDVNMNYIKSILFHDVCIEIVTVKQSALSLFAFLKFDFMCVYVYIFLCFYFSLRCLIHCHCCYIRCMYACYVLNKDQSINQSMLQSALVSDGCV